MTYLARCEYPDKLAVGNVAEVVRFYLPHHPQIIRGQGWAICLLFGNFLASKHEHQRRAIKINFMKIKLNFKKLI